MFTTFTRNQLRNQKVPVAGYGRFGACLAVALSETGYDILVIDKQKSAFRRFSDGLQGFEIEGDAMDVNVLEACDISYCNIVLVATDNDNTNCMIAQTAATIYHIEQAYIRLNDPGKEKLLEQTPIRAIYSARLSVQEFEQVSHIALKGAAVL